MVIDESRITTEVSIDTVKNYYVNIIKIFVLHHKSNYGCVATKRTEYHKKGTQNVGDVIMKNSRQQYEVSEDKFIQETIQNIWFGICII